MGLICPKCSANTVTKLIGSIEIDYCQDGCKGIWFDQDELKKIKEDSSLEADLESLDNSIANKTKEEAIKEKTICCPRCKLDMFRYNWGISSDIFIDSCDQCNGIWFDSGELLALKNYLVQQKHAEQKLDPDLMDKLEEIKEETSLKLEKNRQENLNKLIDWDILFFDDILRFVVDKMT